MRFLRQTAIILIPPVTTAVVAWLANAELTARFMTIAVVWVFAYGMNVITSFLPMRTKVGGILSATLQTTTFVYLVFESILAIILLLASGVGVRWCVIVQIIPAAGFLGVYLRTMQSNEAVVAQVASQEAYVSWWRSVESDLESALDAVSFSRRHAIESVLEELRYSPVMGSTIVAGVERSISEEASRLLVTVRAGDGDIEERIMRLHTLLSSRQRLLISGE